MRTENRQKRFGAFPSVGRLVPSRPYKFRPAARMPLLQQRFSLETRHPIAVGEQKNSSTPSGPAGEVGGEVRRLVEVATPKNGRENRFRSRLPRAALPIANAQKAQFF
jgi:hypothetical protein